MEDIRGDGLVDVGKWERNPEGMVNRLETAFTTCPVKSVDVLVY